MTDKIIKYWYLIFITILCASCGITRNATSPQVTQNIAYREHPRVVGEQLDSLQHIYGKNKQFSAQFLEPTLIALSYYPELRDCHIEFRLSKGTTTMAARPKIGSMFFKRKYVITINTKEEFDGILLENVPFNAQIGVIAHELAHIADYENHNFIGIASILCRFAHKKRKAHFEREIDRSTIERGAGWQLYDWANYSMNTNPYATEEYKEFKRTYYMHPEEIERLILHYRQF